MGNKILKVGGIVLGIVLIGQSTASADFEGPFAPSAWTGAGTATSNSLTANQMQIESIDDNSGFNSFSYTANVPGNTISISFDYQYVTADVNGSPFDMAMYAINGVEFDIVANDIPQNGTETGTITLSNFSGETFAIIQEALDSQLGAATITITNFQASFTPSDFLIGVSAPALLVDSNGQASCTAGSYKFATGSAAEINSFVYTLFVNNQPVSRMASDPASALLSHLFAPITHSVQGLTLANKATWDLSKLANFDAYCEVTVVKSGSLATLQSNQFTDAAKLAAANAEAKAWEDQRAAANAANFTKEAREMRKRIAARSGN